MGRCTDAAPGGTDFTLIQKHPEQGAGDRGFEVGIGEEDAGRLAAQLE